MLSLLIVLFSLVAIISLIAIIYPLPKLHLPTRKRALLVCLIASMISGGLQSSDEEGSTASSPSSQRTTSSSSRKQAKQIMPTAITFQEVDAKFGLNSSLTELQKKEIWKSYENKCIQWTGRLEHLDTGLFGGIQIGMKHNSATFTYDVLISAPNSEKERLMQWKMGHAYTYKGRLKDWGAIIPISVDWGCH